MNEAAPDRNKQVSSGISSDVSAIPRDAAGQRDAVVEALSHFSLGIGTEIAPRLPAVYGEAGGRSLGLALKSGNFGGPDFLERAVTGLGAA